MANPILLTLGIRSLDEASCKQMLGNSGVCSVAVELPDVKREDHFLIWALQVAGSTAGAPNAYAQSSNNRIVINKALDLAFAEDLEAKACVLAHEMAHLQQDHTKQMKKALAGGTQKLLARLLGRCAMRTAPKATTSFGLRLPWWPMPRALAIAQVWEITVRLLPRTGTTRCFPHASRQTL